MFFLFIGGTELSKVPGLSSAGANPEVVPLTAPADADVVQFGYPEIVDRFPLDPDGHPTPAIITRAAVLEADIPCCIVRTGSYIPPTPPYVETGADFARNPCFEQAVPNAKTIFERSRHLAEHMGRQHKSVMLAESVPGGTTTALLALRAMGYDDMVSSGGPVNPTSQKESVWEAVASRLGIEKGGMSGDPLRIITEMGDPMQAAILGFITGLPKETDITLAGGTQMLAIASMLKVLAPAYRPLIATTKYVVCDKSSSFTALADTLGLDVYSAQLDFSDSPHKGLGDYEKGFIKEGAGAGGSVLYAENKGVSVKRVADRTNALYEEVLRKETE